MSLFDDVDRFADEAVAEYIAGGLEPDGVGLAFGGAPEDDLPLALGWGLDVLLVDGDIDEFATEADPMDPEAVTADLERRLSTSHGRLIDDPELLAAVDEDSDYGFNLHQLLHVGISPIRLMWCRDMAAAECLKDDRVVRCSVEISSRGGVEFGVVVSGELKTGQAYGFVMSVQSAAKAAAEGLP